MGWNYLSNFSGCGLGMDKQFQPTFYWACDFSSILVLNSYQGEFEKCNYNRVSSFITRRTVLLWSHILDIYFPGWSIRSGLGRLITAFSFRSLLWTLFINAEREPYVMSMVADVLATKRHLAVRSNPTDYIRYIAHPPIVPHISGTA